MDGRTEARMILSKVYQVNKIIQKLKLKNKVEGQRQGENEEENCSEEGTDDWRKERNKLLR